jgi:hypothetical protein
VLLVPGERGEGKGGAARRNGVVVGHGGNGAPDLAYRCSQKKSSF